MRAVGVGTPSDCYELLRGSEALREASAAQLAASITFLTCPSFMSTAQVNSDSNKKSIIRHRASRSISESYSDFHASSKQKHGLEQ